MFYLSECCEILKDIFYETDSLVEEFAFGINVKSHEQQEIERIENDSTTNAKIKLKVEKHSL